MPQNLIYVYVLVDPRYPDDVRYVGVTKNPSARLKQHVNSARNNNKTHRTHWINSLLSEGLKPVMNIIDESDEVNWEQCEIGWITYYRTMGYNLVNSTDGGRGTLNPSDETRRKLSEANRGKIVTAETRRKISERASNPSDETRRKMSESGRNRPPMSDETRRKISILSRNPSDQTRQKIADIHRGRKCTEQTRYKISKAMPHKRMIYQYDKFGHFVRQWDSVSLASRELGIGASHIRTRCKMKNGTAGGYIWRYADDPLPTNETQLRLFQMKDEDDNS